MTTRKISRALRRCWRVGSQIAERGVDRWDVVRRLTAPLAIVGLGAAAWAYLGGGYPNFDAAYAVVWGDQLVEGELAEYATEYAPTPHPLATGFGALGALVGEGAYDMLAAVAYLSLGALVWAVYALGRECYSWRVGLLAAAIVATSFPILSRAAATYFDVLTAALIVLAGLLEARGRRGVPVLVLLGVAGLQRPEAWLLAAGYWFYLMPTLDVRQRLRLGALAAAAPVLWATMDLIVTGDPAFSFTGTRSAAQEAAHDGRGSTPLLSAAAEGLRNILRVPALLGGLAGALLALAFLRARSRIPLTLLVVGAVSFVGLGVAGLPVVDRFLFLPAAALAIFFGVAALGWLDQPDLGPSSARARRLRAAWIVGGAVILVVLIASLPAQIDRLQRLSDEVRLRARAVDDLRAVAESQPAGDLLRRCRRVYLPNEQLIPILSYTLDRAPHDLHPSPRREPRRGVYLEPRAQLLAANAFYLDSNAGPAAPVGFPRVAESRYWTVRARGCGGARAEARPPRGVAMESSGARAR